MEACASYILQCAGTFPHLGYPQGLFTVVEKGFGEEYRFEAELRKLMTIENIYASRVCHIH